VGASWSPVRRGRTFPSEVEPPPARRRREPGGHPAGTTDETEDALRESEERFRGTFENAGVGIADCDVQGRFLRVQPEALRDRTATPARSCSKRPGRTSRTPTIWPPASSSFPPHSP